MFSTEVSQLKIRLNELDSVVDKFVLLEGTKTFQNEPKELHFEENKEKFGEHLDKIEHIILEDFPDDVLDKPWKMQYYSRNKLVDGLGDLSDNDYVLLSDIDEIPNPAILQDYADMPALNILMQDLFYYNYNTKVINKKWLGPVLARGNCFSTPQSMREISGRSINYSGNDTMLKIREFINSIYSSAIARRVVNIVENGGWHFSYIGDTNDIINKLNSISSNKARETEWDPQDVETALRNNKDLFDRKFSFEQVPIDEHFPYYIYNNVDEFEEYIK